MYNIIQADTNEPVPPVITSVFPLKASVICIMVFSSLSKAPSGADILWAPALGAWCVIILFELRTGVLNRQASSAIP